MQSVPLRGRFAAGCVLLALAALMAAVGAPQIAAETPDADLERGRIRFAGKLLEVEVARTHAERARGLSNREFLPEGTGMLFVYPYAGRRSMWMKDMRFPLDILWFDAERVLVHVEPDVAPETYPESFSSPRLAMYVLELPAGYASRAGVAPGDSFQWE